MSRPIFALLLSSVRGVSLAAQSTDATWRAVRQRFDGARAKATVAFLNQHVRWPGNRGYDASIAHIVERLDAAGYVRQERATASDRLVYRVERYPMSAPAWEPLHAGRDGRSVGTCPRRTASGLARPAGHHRPLNRPLPAKSAVPRRHDISC